MKLSLLIASRPVTAEISLNDIETKRIVWYKQPVDNHTGKLYGEAVGFQGFNSVNTSWFQAALHNSWGYSSVENEWNSGVGPLFLTSVGILGRAVVSLGVPVKRLTHLFSVNESKWCSKCFMHCTRNLYLEHGAESSNGKPLPGKRILKL
ncbi:hypothetical protein V6N13_093641 [Hibiscus sabdariffa]